MVYTPNGKTKGWSAGKEFVPRQQCVICGKDYYAAPTYIRQGRGKCCSHKCAADYRGLVARSNRVEVKCLTCSKVMQLAVSHAKRKRYCSKDCMPSLPVRVCPECGQPHQGKGIYCAAACYHKVRENVAMEKKLKGNSICDACGQSYWATASSRGRVCSRACWGAIQAQANLTVTHSRGKGGRRDDLDDRYFRSRWEANYARYLNWLVANKQIAKWEYEVDTFEFANIKRGTRHYTPDFKVWENDGSYSYHEVKGWMDATSKTKLRRFAKYYPTEKLILIDRPAYKSIAVQMKRVLPGWESGAKTGF